MNAFLVKCLIKMTQAVSGDSMKGIVGTQILGRRKDTKQDNVASQLIVTFETQ